MTEDKPMEGGERRPVPDPTTLTTQALHRDIGAARELLEERINGLTQLTDERLSSVGKRLEWDELIASSFKERIDKVERAISRVRYAVIGTGLVILLTIGITSGVLAVRGGP